RQGQIKALEEAANFTEQYSRQANLRFQGVLESEKGADTDKVGTCALTRHLKSKKWNEATDWDQDPTAMADHAREASLSAFGVKGYMQFTKHDSV
ncbi:hypothetical protein LSAT2_000794, partial [Lamellibrachia satsuma]